MKKDLTGKHMWFEYHCFESEESCDAKLWHHSHQRVYVLHRLTNIDPQIVGGMYRVRFPNNFEYDVFREELVTNPRYFHRPQPPPKIGLPSLFPN